MTRARPPQPTGQATGGWESVRAIATTLADVEESASYGTPGFKVNGRMFVRLLEDGDSAVVFVGFDEREMLVQACPEMFVVTSHYRDHPMLVIRLGMVDKQELGRLVEQSYATTAAKLPLRRR